MINIYGKRSKGDRLLLISVITVALFGLVMVYSASSYVSFVTYGDKFYLAKKHLIGLLTGLALMIFSCNFDYRKYRGLGLPLLIISVVLLALVFTPLGIEKYGATRWINVFGLSVQPSEFAKISFVLFAAAYFSKNPARAKSLLGILPIIAAGGMVCLLIILEPNMSITVCVGLLMLAMLFAAGMKMKHFILFIVILGAAVPVLIIAEPYRLQRLSAFLNPWASPKEEGYQLLQSLYGLGSGGWFGVGLFNSRQKFKFLPFSESDFILSVIGEELGFIGTAIFFAVLFFIIVRGVRIAGRSKNCFGFLLAVGITSLFGIQTLINALVVTGSIPPTGLPLPLVSRGNTSLIVFLFSFGILYNISKDLEKT